MKAFSITKPGIFEQTDVPERPLGDNDVVIAVKFVGMCGSDLHSYLGTSPMVKYPVIPGHEISGVITEVGKNASEFSVGETVTVMPYFNCSECYPCKEGRPNCCQFNKTLGVQTNGVLSERFTVDKSHVLSSPLSYELTALVEPFAIGWHAAARTGIKPGDHTAVLGCGAVGIGVMLAAHTMGAHVIACDISGDKLEWIKNFAGFDTFDLKEDIEKIKELTNGEGITSAIDATGSSKALPTMLNMINFAGRAGIVGYANGITEIESRLIVSKELNFHGSRNADMSDFANVISMIGKDEFDYSKLISAIFPLDKADKVFDYWQKNRDTVVKILIKMD